MSIATAVLADSPTLYWPLDDPTGPAALDASGNANHGFYTGTVNLDQPGPEAGTLCVLLQSGGGVLSLGASPRGIVPFSMDCWVASEAPQGVGNVIIYNGNSSATGLGQAWGTSNLPNQSQKLLRGGIAFGGDAGSMFQGAWHHVAFTVDAGSNYSEYVDGTNVASAAGLGFNAIGASDHAVAGAASFGNQMLYMAHVAIYPAALTAARVLAHATSASVLQTPAQISTPVSSDLAAISSSIAGLNVDLTAINATLAAILAAVRRTF